ncbi:MAG TPA: hypothetical protein VLK34_01670 [Nocardioidaceae bacterium]|nr:hypothetical protein [Nocardioidaceae bacterium]
MSYVGFIAEELMHGREADTKRMAEGYRRRAAAKAGRKSGRRVRATGREGTVRTASVPC